MPNLPSTSTVMNMYGILLGSSTYRVEFLPVSGRAVSRPEMSCEPSFPEISALPGTRLFFTVRGTNTSLKALLRALSLESRTPNDAIMSAAPFSGRPGRVFSPVMRTGPLPSTATMGIISRVSRPDSPTWTSFRSIDPAVAPMPVMVNVPAASSTGRTVAPRLRATARADSLSPQGE